MKVNLVKSQKLNVIDIISPIIISIPYTIKKNNGLKGKDN